MEGLTFNEKLDSSVSVTENMILQSELIEDIKTIIREHSNDYDLGGKIRKLGIDYLEVNK